MLRRDRPSTFSNAELAKRHRRSGVTTATIVASRSSAACAAAWPAGAGGRGRRDHWRRRRKLVDLALEGGDVALLARDRGASSRRPGRGTSGSSARRPAARAGRCCSPSSCAASLLLLACAARPRGCAGRRCRVRAGRPDRRGRPTPLPAAAAPAPPPGAAWSIWITVTGAPSILRQPSLSPLPWRVIVLRVVVAGAAIDDVGVDAVGRAAAASGRGDAASPTSERCGIGVQVHALSASSTPGRAGRRQAAESAESPRREDRLVRKSRPIKEGDGLRRPRCHVAEAQPTARSTCRTRPDASSCGSA